MQPNLFFESSKNFSKQITDIYDFIWPTSVALWNLRWQVKGMVSEIPDIDETTLLGRFVGGSRIRGVNLRKSCIDISWKEQENQLAKIMLSEFCALYEAWYKDFNREIAVPIENPKTFEYYGITELICSLEKCPGLESSIYPKLRKHRKYTGEVINKDTPLEETIFSKKCLKSLIYTYRYFKETRNANIHHGGLPTHTTFTAYDNFREVEPDDLLAKEIPEHPTPITGEKLNLTLRGVVGFGDVVLKLISTIDAEFARSTQAHTYLKMRWQAKSGPAKVLPSERPAAQRMIESSFRKMHLATPIFSSDLIDLLKRLRLVQSF